MSHDCYRVKMHTGSVAASEPLQTILPVNRAHNGTILSVKALFELLRRGVFLNPMGTKLYLSLAHTEADLDEFTAHFAAALQSTRPS